jgi:hypothetical protein
MTTIFAQQSLEAVETSAPLDQAVHINLGADEIADCALIVV